MPTRDRNHELETESQRAFEAAMPSSLVVRPISDDYGIDREVEVFADGKTTGLTFKVQLKATDKSGKTRRIKREHLDYWNSLDVPVLLVSYEAPSNLLRARWVHSIGMDGPDTGAATVTVHMDPRIDLGGKWVEGLADDLYVIRAVRRGDLPSPMPVRVQVDDGASRLPVVQVAAVLLKASRRTSSPMIDASGSSTAALTFHLSENRAQCSLPLGLASCTLHVESGFLYNADADTIAGLALTLAAGTLAKVDEATARQWALAVDPASAWWSIPEVSERLVPVLAHPDGAKVLLAVHANLVGDQSPAADSYMLPLLDLVDEVPAEEFMAYSKAVEQAITPDAEGGRLAHNLGQLHKARRAYGSAVELLTKAAEHAPGYLTNALYRRHLGACEWELGHYAEAVEHYRSALSHGFDAHELLPLLADALMYAGRYAEAREALSDWTPTGERNDRVGLLRRIVLNFFNDLGLTVQDRKVATGTPWPDDKAPEFARDDLLTLIRGTDALNPALWALMINAEDPAESFAPAIVAAVLATDFAYGWTAALICALAAGSDSATIQAILDQARLDCGDDFFDAVMDAADHHEAAEAAVLRDLVSKTWSSAPEAFEHHLRLVDSSHADWVVEDVTFKASAKGT